MENNERPPFRDMQGLLKFALQGTASEDASQSPVQPLDPERQQWLEEALKNLSVDVVEELKKGLSLLVSEGISDPKEDPEPFEQALDSLIDMVESIDFSNDFFKIGGFTVLPTCLNSAHPGVRWRTASLIGTLTQNNPYCQERALDAGLFPSLLSKVEEDEDEKVRVKCLYALGSITRDYKEAEKALADSDGYSVLLRVLQTNSEALRTKAAFFLTSLCRSSPNILETVCKMGFAEQIIGLLHSEKDGTHEHLLSALLAIARDHEPAREECTSNNLGLQQILRDKIKECVGDESRNEEAQYCQELLELCFRGEPAEDR